MNPEELTSCIKNNNKTVKNLVKNITTLNKKLLKEVEQQALLMELLKEETKTTFSRVLADTLNTPAQVALDHFKHYRQAASRKKIDKKFLENVGIIDRPTRKESTKKEPTSSIMVVGNLVGNVRSMVERKALSSGDKAIAKAMIDKLIDEL